MRRTKPTVRKNPGVEYHYPDSGEAFWMPECVRNVAARYGWGIAYVEQHPDGATIVTFASAGGKPVDAPGHIWEMAIEVVEAMDDRDLWL